MEATKKVYLVYHTHFDAAHYLRNYKGKCANTHGHRWEVLVKISGRLEDQPDGYHPGGGIPGGQPDAVLPGASETDIPPEINRR